MVVPSRSQVISGLSGWSSGFLSLPQVYAANAAWVAASGCHCSGSPFDGCAGVLGADGVGSGVVEGLVDGVVDGVPSACGGGPAAGALPAGEAGLDGWIVGCFDGAVDGLPDGVADGLLLGVVVGVAVGVGVGVPACRGVHDPEVAAARSDRPGGPGSPGWHPGRPRRCGSEPEVVISASPIPAPFTRWEMMFFASFSFSAVTAPPPPTAVAVSVMVVPPRRSRPSFGFQVWSAP